MLPRSLIRISRLYLLVRILAVYSPSLCPWPLNAEKPLPAPLLALLQLPAVSMRLNLHFALCCKCAQVEVMLRRCVFFQHRNRDTFGGAIPSTFGQDLSVRSL